MDCLLTLQQPARWALLPLLQAQVVVVVVV
jgi:hypothetical protein